MKTTCHLIVVHQQASQHLDVIGSESGAARRDGSRHSGEVAGHDVGVALDDDRLLVLRDLPTGQVDAVEHVGLLIDRRFRSVQVLGAVVVIGEFARPETNDVSAEIADRPNEPSAKSVVHTPVALTDQSPGQQFFIGKSLTAQEAGQSVPGRRSESDSEVLGAAGVEPAGFQEVAPGCGGG